VTRVLHRAIRPTILVAVLALGALLLGQGGLTDSDASVTPYRSTHTTAAAATPALTRPASQAQASPRGKIIYKGHTLEEIRADPSLLAEILSEADYIRPVHGEPDPPLTNYGSDTVCPNHVECPSVTRGSDAFLKTQFALMEATGSVCVSSFDGQLFLGDVDIDGMVAQLGRGAGVLPDGRGWLGSIDDARNHFGGTVFVAEGGAEHWFITIDAPTLDILHATRGPAAAALIEVPLADARTVWYLGPRWSVSIPC